MKSKRLKVTLFLILYIEAFPCLYKFSNVGSKDLCRKIKLNSAKNYLQWEFNMRPLVLLSYLPD